MPRITDHASRATLRQAQGRQRHAPRSSPRLRVGLAWLCVLVSLAGCGTTRWTDTKRTATEQMLISDAIDRAVSRIDFRILAGKDVYLDTSFLGETVDKEYLTGTLRQQMVSSGCILKEKREQAAFIVEARAGTVGTDHHDLLYGMPSINLPTFAAPVPGGARHAECLAGTCARPANGPTGDGQDRRVRLPSRDRRRGLAIGGRHRRRARPAICGSSAPGRSSGARSTTTRNSPATTSTCHWSPIRQRPTARRFPSASRSSECSTPRAHSPPSRPHPRSAQIIRSKC